LKRKRVDAGAELNESGSEGAAAQCTGEEERSQVEAKVPGLSMSGEEEGKCERGGKHSERRNGANEPR
jgi:hypothetical protein